MLPRSQRITESADYARLFKDAAVGHGRLVTVRCRPAAVTRAGIIVSKKAAPLATDRNRIKRLLRAVLRSMLPELAEPSELVVIAKAAARDAAQPELREDLGRALTAARKTAT